MSTERWRRLIRERGVWFVVRAAVARAGLKARRGWLRRRERRFDRVLGVDTAGVGSVPLDVDAVRYQATAPEAFARAFEVLDADPASATFIDLGCGKGRTLLLAQQLGFRSIVGVEIDSALAEVARRNISRSAASNVEVRTGDAGAYKFDAEPTVVYLYNPFLERTMQRVLDNLEASVRANPRPIYVIYYNPVVRRLIDERRFLRVIAEMDDLVVYASVEFEPPLRSSRTSA